MSQLLRSRRKVLGGALLLTAAAMVAYFTVAARSPATFYATCFALGLATGYWAVFVTVASVTQPVVGAPVPPAAALPWTV